VRALVLGRGAEADGLMAVLEEDVKVGHETVDVVLPRDGNPERRREGRILLLHRLDVKRRNERLVAAHLARVDNVHQRLGQRRPSDAVHVEPVVVEQ